MINSPRRKPKFTKGSIVKVCAGWCDAGRCGTVLAQPIYIEQWWVPVLWHDDADPDFFKAAGLKLVNMKDFFTTLQKACKGLSFISETDAPLEPFVWKDGAELTNEHLIELAEAEEDSFVSRMSLAGFFRAVSKENRPKFDALAKVLNANLTDITVYKIGEIEIDVYIAGKTAAGPWAGVKTFVVET